MRIDKDDESTSVQGGKGAKSLFRVHFAGTDLVKFESVKLSGKYLMASEVGQLKATTNSTLMSTYFHVCLSKKSF